ncbi:putative spermidine/putrescine transport system substrate-binding protein/spermidine/putrescine transport system substrate-binding protein [Roseovarius nanhaiticus]|uniref:Putative spermidine/putrescine transport system substrate-binding protein/spermidine/putrescine transport system substrate-binding protein n=1 Tax=Roseovarius nanhaiticus TaxID=573024 RepID=A0A1N7F9Z0_9RHOB|nr:extracellular solute-binding protein [Roseovarius nanhaiticus]SEK58842.1 putative spermidine/putrescine transport system substrate-binding protein/spermidine/putrescine transport system substrate-binding protein [Roseovarius nanhaiticus]SIR97147.1 putative spermidine/putrescine transport system substrate-binding protein/spermidine/putrescine transport system substrate-binding protein [Roseovarius nanhaiticus]
MLSPFAFLPASHEAGGDRPAKKPPNKEKHMSAYRNLALAVSSAALMSAAGAGLAAGGDLVVFDWAGYEDPGFFQSYIDEHGEAPTYAFFGDEEEAFQKLRAGFEADVAHPCSQSVPKWMDAGLLAPLDTSRIDRWDELEPGFRDIEAYMKDGDHYLVPVDWGNTALIYNTEELSEEDVQSLNVFIDPKHQGRISIGDNVDDAYALAFLATGVQDWTKATDEDFQEASDWLRKLHQNVRTYWSDGASLRQLMQSGEVYLTWSWNETFATMSGEGFPIAMKRDTDEGASSWVCGYSRLASGSEENEDLFYDFINAWLEPGSAEYIVTQWGYGHSNVEAMADIPEETLTSVGLNVNDELRANTLWQAPVGPELREKMIAEFEMIKAGF